MTGKKKRKPTSSLKTKVGSERSHVTRHVAEEARNKSSEANTFRSDEKGGNLDVQLSLAVEDVDLGFVGKDAQGSGGLIRESRPKALSKTLNEQEVNAEKAVHTKRQRAGQLGSNLALRLALRLNTLLILMQHLHLTRLSHHCTPLLACHR